MRSGAVCRMLAVLALLAGLPQPRCCAAELPPISADGVAAIGEGASPAFPLYLGPGFLLPTGGGITFGLSSSFALQLGPGFASQLSAIGYGTSGAFQLALGPGFVSASSGIGTSQSGAFGLYLGRLSEGSALSRAFPLDTRNAGAAPELSASLENCGQAVRLNWTDPSAGVSPYLVEARYDGFASTFATLATTSAGVATFLDTRANGYPYRYRLRATSTVGGGYSNEVASGFAAYTGIPPAPSSLVVKSVGDGQYLHLWVGPPTNSTTWSGLTQVILEVSEQGQPTFTIPFPLLDAPAGPFRIAFPGALNHVYSFRAWFRDGCEREGAPSVAVPGTPRHAPVVFVHGICGSGSDWNGDGWSWPSVFATVGIDRWQAVSFIDKDASWTAWVRPLHDRVQSLLANGWSGDEQVDIVAYSQGGLAARSVVEQTPDGASFVRNLVMLGTPHHGGMFSTLARILGVLPNWKCQTHWPDAAPGLDDLNGGSKPLNKLNYRRATVDGERRRAEECAAHPAENLRLGPGDKGPNGVTYWTVAGTGGIASDVAYSVFQSIRELTVCTSDGIVPAASAHLAALPTSQQYFDTELSGVGYLEHSKGLSAGVATPIQDSQALAGHVAAMLIGSPPPHGNVMAAAAASHLGSTSAGTDTTTLLGAFQDTAPLGGSVTRAVNVETADSLTVVVGWPDSLVSVQLLDPSGRALVSGTTDGPMGHQFERSTQLGYTAYRVRAPAPGLWSLKLSGGGAAGPSQVVSYWATSGSVIVASGGASPDSVAAGDTVTVTFSIRNGATRMPLTALASLRSPSGAQSTFELQDGGVQGDKTPLDGIYSAQIIAGQEDGLWTVSFDAVTTGDGGVHRSGSAVVLVQHAPAIALVPGSFIVTPTEPAFGGSAGIALSLRNAGADEHDSLNVVVADLSTGHEVSSLVKGPVIGQDQPVALAWTPDGAGMHRLRARVTNALAQLVAPEESLAILVTAGGLIGVDNGVGVMPVFLAYPAPNPTAGSALIRYSIKSAGRVDLRVYNVAGRLVSRLVDSIRPAGASVVTWPGIDDAGRRVPAGVYFVRIAAPGITANRKLVVLR